MSAVEKSVALMNAIGGPMDQPCPVCRGGWWYSEGELEIFRAAMEGPPVNG